MDETFEFDPITIDRAIQHLNKVLALMDRHESQVGGLRHGTRPGEAPSTQAFHALLGRSMGRLREKHDALRRHVEDQIEVLRKTKAAYTAVDRDGAETFVTIGEQV
ncbi:hypothetical protein KIPE111705_15090 [Kibdelosporangium persicum]|uniref:Excreted virulence factor EspC, type VII ESX diderm n=1 Tax=Kibdelosporangium persicum TaxID=2698649 RepID=A0ABX2FE66_9PSEU|nr:hypothetical protein [Kibdelosporangium persicum]NRN69513.1 hypothetical protein [Kibdelosporangium persicum]